MMSSCHCRFRMKLSGVACQTVRAPTAAVASLQKNHRSHHRHHSRRQSSTRHERFFDCALSKSHRGSIAVENRNGLQRSEWTLSRRYRTDHEHWPGSSGISRPCRLQPVNSSEDIQDSRLHPYVDQKCVWLVVTIYGLSYSPELKSTVQAVVIPKINAQVFRRKTESVGQMIKKLCRWFRRTHDVLVVVVCCLWIA